MGYANGDRELICLNCGQRDSADDAIRIVAEYARHEAVIQLERKVADNASGNRFATFKIKATPRQKFRWRLTSP
jgi:hypothetical protein